MSEVTVEARVDPSVLAAPQLEAALTAYADLWGHLERRLFQQLYAGGNKPSAERVREVKRAFIRDHRISARQFNGMRMNLMGKVDGWRESQKERLADVLERIRKLRQAIAKRERTESLLSRHIVALQPARRTPRVQGIQDRRARIRYQLHQKKRRLQHLETEVDKLRLRLEAAPAFCFGGRALFRQQFHLAEHGFADHGAWLAAWRERRSSQFYAIGSKDEVRGNGECQFDPDQGLLRLRLPKALEPAFGRHLWIRADFYRATDLLKALERGRAISYRFLRRGSARWYAQATTHREPAPITSRRELGAVGADLNADHVAVADLDRFGNLARHRKLALDVHGLSSAQAEARIADSAAELVLLAKESGKPLVIEALDFRKKKAALRELGKARARTLSGFAFAQFQARVASRCECEGVELIQVNPAYTSTIGYAKFGSYSISSPVAAAMAIGRRGLGFGERLAARSTSPRLGSALVTRLKEIAASRKAGEHVWKFWRQLTPSRYPLRGYARYTDCWLRAALRKQSRPRSVPSGGARHPRGGLPPPGTVRSSGDSGFRTPAVLVVGTAAP